ncbi:MAG: DUF255 domain-containing protein [Acidobacteriota bacterium]
MAATGGGRDSGLKNRLADETSPYLLLHRRNPVDWYPWGEEALARARDESKPIFLSVGYSTCYWCHVMERESFSDAGVAQLMNEHFVNIKVDREERPELDEIYMAATQIYTGQGGWPNSVFLTPALRPFFAGTYFPPMDAHGRPSFRNVVQSMIHAWTERRDDVEAQAGELADAMRRMLEERAEPADAPASAATAEASKRALLDRYDAEHGGFGGTPKFPSPANLFLLLDFAERGDEEAARAVDRTLDAMARGGLYDQLAGGFHRYATDRAWKIPHFEKMLYDNGLLLEVYARDYARTGSLEHERILRETAAFLAAELTAPGGGFWSAIDAEIGGREGAHHVWTLDELVEVLGEEDASFLAPLLGFANGPIFDREYFVLHRPEPLDEAAARRRLDRFALLDQVKPLEAKLLSARRQRPMPAVDDKILTDWNGLTIAGLATAGMLLEDVGLIRQAASAAEFLLDHLRGPDGTLRHTWRRRDGGGPTDGEARFDAYLSDYVFLVRGLLALHEATDDGRWLAEAERLSAEQQRRLEDDEHGGFFAAGEQPDILFRSKEIFDAALPSTQGAAILNLLALAERSEDGDSWLALAERALRAFAVSTETQPAGARTMARAARVHQRQSAAPDPEEAVRATVANLVEKAAQAIVTATAELATPADADGWREIQIHLAIKDGWHIESAESTSAAATRLEVTSGELGAVRWPGAVAVTDDAGGPRGYRGAVDLVAAWRGGSDGEPGLRLTFLPCDDARCLTSVTIDVPCAPG